MCREFGLPAWVVETQEVHAILLAEERIGELKYLGFDAQESWMIRLMQARPDVSRGVTAPSVFHSSAVEMRGQPLLYVGAYAYREAQSWYGVGLQILLASGWWPDCAIVAELYVLKTSPPHAGGNIVVEPSELMK